MSNWWTNAKNWFVYSTADSKKVAAYDNAVRIVRKAEEDYVFASSNLQAAVEDYNASNPQNSPLTVSVPATEAQLERIRKRNLGPGGSEALGAALNEAREARDAFKSAETETYLQAKNVGLTDPNKSKTDSALSETNTQSGLGVFEGVGPQPAHQQRTAAGLDSTPTPKSNKPAARPGLAGARAGRSPQGAAPATEAKVTTTYGQQQRFKQQCYLLSRIKNFAKFSTTLHENYKVGDKDYSRKLPYEDGSTNAVIPVMGEPFGLMNRLTGDLNTIALHSLTPAQISALIPLIRIFKAIKQSNGTEIHNEILFDTHVTRNDMTVFETRAARGAGSGLRSFDIAFDGSNFFTAKKAIKAKLSMHFDSFNDIIRTRRGPRGTFRYIDLALRTASNKGVKRDANRDSFPENYRIKVIMGWAVPMSGLDRELFPDPDVRDAIQKSAVVLNLVMVDHKFNIDELGRVEFDIDYAAYIDAAFSTKYANVLTNMELMEKYLNREASLKIISKMDCTASEKGELKKELVNERDKDKRTALKTLLTKLANEKKMFYHVIPISALDSFNRLGPWSDASVAIKDGENFVQNDVERDILNIIDAYKEEKDLPENLTGLVRRPTSNKEYILPFFFLGDLLNAGLGNISEFTSGAQTISYGLDDVDEDFLTFSHSFKQLRILTGDIELVHPKTGAVYRTNMADVPISVDYFVEWFMGKVIAKGGEAEYPLVNFARDLMNSILSVAADEHCFGAAAMSKVHARASYLSGMPLDQQGTEPCTQAATQSGIKRIIIDKNQTATAGPLIITNDSVEKLASERKNTYQYIVFYASRAYPHDRTANYANDAASNIIHLQIGRGEGMVKNIQFSKAEQKYFKELRFELEGYEGLAQVREPYDATITMFGNMTFYPGSYIYLDPRGLGSMMGNPQDDRGMEGFGSISWQLGLGGYYMVKKTASRISSGVFETTVYATWVARGGKNDPELAPAVMASTAEECGTPTKEIENVAAPERSGYGAGALEREALRMGGYRGSHITPLQAGEQSFLKQLLRVMEIGSGL